jgi:MFS family permease
MRSVKRCLRGGGKEEPDVVIDANGIATPVTTDSTAATGRKKVTDLTCYPLFMLSLIALCINADQNLVAPNLTQIAREFNFTDDERDYLLGGQLSVGFFLVGGFAAMIVGYLADRMNRRNLLAIVVIIGELSTFFTLFVTSYWGLFTTRAITGVSIGGSNPLIMSMIGDMYNDRNRGKAISIITVMFTLGVGLGQSVAGFIGAADASGWRAPFAVMAIPVFILAPLLVFTTKDPPRGGKEKAVEAIGDEFGDAAVEHVYEEKMDVTKLKLLLRNKTAVLAFVQGIPGSLPWGVLLVYFQDFLVQNIGPTIPGGITVQESSVVILCFGIGASVGTALGGVISDRTWRRGPRGVPLFMGFTAALATVPIYGLINAPPSSIAIYSVVLFPCGLIAGLVGPAIRVVLMNVTLPETRGTAFAFHTLFDDIGKGLGPLWVSLLIAGTGSRVTGFNFAITGWLVCAVIMFIMCCTIKSDLRKLEAATLAALERRRVRNLQPSAAATFGTIPLSTMPNKNPAASPAMNHQSSSQVYPMDLDGILDTPAVPPSASTEDDASVKGVIV